MGRLDEHHHRSAEPATEPDDQDGWRARLPELEARKAMVEQRLAEKAEKIAQHEAATDRLRDEAERDKQLLRKLQELEDKARAEAEKVERAEAKRTREASDKSKRRVAGAVIGVEAWRVMSGAAGPDAQIDRAPFTPTPPPAVTAPYEPPAGDPPVHFSGPVKAAPVAPAPPKRRELEGDDEPVEVAKRRPHVEEQTTTLVIQQRPPGPPPSRDER